MLNLIFSSVSSCWISSWAQFNAQFHLRLHKFMLKLIFSSINSCWNSSSAQSIHAEPHLQLNQYMLNFIFSSIQSRLSSKAINSSFISSPARSIHAHLQLHQYKLNLIFSLIHCWISSSAQPGHADQRPQLNQYKDEPWQIWCLISDGDLKARKRRHQIWTATDPPIPRWASTSAKSQQIKFNVLYLQPNLTHHS